MFLQEPTPDTLNYMFLGFGVFIGLILLYVLSLVTRFRSLEQDIALLESLNDDKR